MGLLPAGCPANRRRVAADQSRSAEVRAALSGWRKLAGNAHCESSLGHHLDAAARPHRRRNGIRLSVVAQVVQIGREELSGFFHEWQWWEQGGGISDAGYGG